MKSLDQLFTALSALEAAGNTEGAKHLSDAIATIQIMTAQIEDLEDRLLDSEAEAFALLSRVGL